MSQQQQLTVPGRYDQIRAVCEFVAAGAKAAQFDEDAIFHIELACDEACTNIIEHAYGSEDAGPIMVKWQIISDRFIITFTDKGDAFDPDTVPLPPSPQAITDLDDLDSLKVGGLGLHFMKKLMDDVAFQFDKKEGNQLIMVKHLKGAT
jgi:serine/threonine-protein kinase RsbW